MPFKCWKELGSPSLVQSHTVQKSFDVHSFSPHRLIISCPIDWGGKIVTMDVEVVDAPIDYNFLLGCNWIHALMAIVSLVSRVVQFLHWWNIVMIKQLDYCMLEIVVQLNVPFTRDAQKEVQDIRIGLLKNDSLMGNFVIQQPLFSIEVSY